MRAASSRTDGFTLMELLAAVTLMVVLGTMLFTVFKNSSVVVRNASGRQQVYQEAKLLMDHMEEELSGAYQSKAGPRSPMFMRPFIVQPNAQEFEITTACKVRDTDPNSVNFGQEANIGRIGYFMGDGRALTNSDGTSNGTAAPNTLYRFEYYSLYESGGQWDDPTKVSQATPFLNNVVSFTVECFDNGAFTKEPSGWNSAPTANKIFPRAVRITVRLTDDLHLPNYLNMANDTNGDGVVDSIEAGDDIGETFQHVAYLAAHGS